MSVAKPHVRTRKILENSRISGHGRGLNAHRMVADTAVKMAMEYWEVYMMENNDLYRAFNANLTEKQMITLWCARIAPMFLEEARLALTDCLSQPDSAVSKKLKDEIVDALIKDTDLRANRSVAAQHAMLPGMVH